MDRKYYQKIIPEVSDLYFSGMKLTEVKKFVTDFFDKNLKDRKIINKQKNITIHVRKSGLRHLFHARNLGYNKIKAVIVLREMIENAIYCNFKNADDNDSSNVIGYFNFKCNVIVEGKKQMFRIVIKITNEGKFYYDHSVKIKKSKD